MTLTDTDTMCKTHLKYVPDSVKYYYDYECNEPLVAYSKLTATSSLRDRGPENAKLYGKRICQNLKCNVCNY